MKNRKIRFLSAGDIEKTLSVAEAIRAVKEAFLQIPNGQAIVPLRTPMALPLLPVNRGWPWREPGGLPAPAGEHPRKPPA